LIILKNRDEIAIMRQAGRIAALALAEMREAVKPGVTTGELDRIATEVLQKNGATPTFVGQQLGDAPPYTATITASVNEELVHGIPGDRVLEEGDIVSLDVGATYKGYVGDNATTVAVGAINGEVQRLLEVTEAALWEGIHASVKGSRVGDVSAAIQQYVESNGFSVVRQYSGHGVGKTMWEDPSIPNWGTPGRGAKLKPGMTYALEPMVLMKDPETHVLGDYWTVVSSDGMPCAHFEHTLAVTDGEPQILTELD
jgi:methionyl aminopeptidase